MQVKCPKCGAVNKYPDECGGQKGKCGKCQAMFTLPRVEQAKRTAENVVTNPVRMPVRNNSSAGKTLTDIVSPVFKLFATRKFSMKLKCMCGQDYVYDHTKAGQQFECSWCKQLLVMPGLDTLSSDDQTYYRRQLNRLQEQEKRAAENAAAKAKKKLDAERSAIEAKRKMEAKRATIESIQKENMERKNQAEEQETTSPFADSTAGTMDYGPVSVKCPRCGCSQISGNKKGMDAGTACCGALLLGPLGLLCGLSGANKVIITCLNCGFQWSKGRG